MQRLTTIQLFKEYLKFSAGHFTIFSATERERLHGHNFSVSASIVAPVDENGLCFSYGDFKKKLQIICESLDEYMILPGKSPHLSITENQNNVFAHFNGEKLQFSKFDCLVLPIRNTTVEEFASYLLAQLLKDSDIKTYQVQSVEMRVSSGPGQWGSCLWSQEQDNQIQECQ